MNSFMAIIVRDKNRLVNIKPLLTENLIFVCRADKFERFENDNITVMSSSKRVRTHTRKRDSLFASAKDEIIVVAACRIDNRRELVAKTNPMLQQVSDAELIATLYQSHQKRFLPWIDGEFAFVIIDNLSGTTLFARDPLGRLPLYYHINQHHCMAATSIKPFLLLPFINKHFDPYALADFLLNVPHDLCSTFSSDIALLPGGCCLTINSKRLLQQRYYTLTRDPGIQHNTHDELVDDFRFRFNNAVYKCTNEAESVGAHVSGGLDSSSIVALCATQFSRLNQDLPLYGAIPTYPAHATMRHGADYHELEFMSTVNNQFDNTTLTPVKANSDSFIDLLDSTFDNLGIPPTNPFNMCWWDAIAQQATDDGVRLLLTGQTGNYTVSYNPHYCYRNLFIRGHFPLLFNLLKSHSRETGLSVVSLFKNLVVAKMLPRKFWQNYSIINGGWNHSVQSCPLNPDFIQTYKIKQRVKDLNWEIQNRWTSNSEAYRKRAILGAVSMSSVVDNGYFQKFGLMFQDPTCDRQLVEFCVSLSEESQINEQYSRLIIRRTMESILPKKIYSRKSYGLQAADWLTLMNNDKKRLAALLNTMKDSSLASTLLDLQQMTRLLNNLPEQNDYQRTTLDRYHNHLARGMAMGKFLMWYENLPAYSLPSI